jgi:5,10-methylene-tetrahydrofolate dehydrogenase/methenyl tetrahydrofolate cyclohydrolase
VEFTLTEVIIMSAPRVLVNGNKLASRIITETKERILEEVEAHPAFYSSFPEWRQPRLDILNVGFQDASLSYIKKKIDLASSIGIRFSLHQFLDDPRHPHHPTFQKIITTSPGNFTIRELSSTHHPHPYQHILTLIDQLNQDKQVSSILLQLPLRAELAEHTKSLI